MKIRSFSTEQFAGITDRSISFSDGINVILGNNESGKSTIINAMYHALNTPAAPKKTTKKPSAEFIKTGSFSTGNADTIDAKMTVTSSGDEYLIKKVWDRSGDETTVSIRKNGDAALKGSQAEEEIKKLLTYGTGIYSNLIFGRQSYEKDVLKWCYGFFNSSADNDSVEVKDKIKEAFSAADGISADKFNDIINKTIDEMSEHWDIEREKPAVKRSGGERWDKGVGTVLSAYYAYDDACKLLEKAKGSELSTAAVNKEISELENTRDDKQKAYDELLKQKNSITEKATVQSLLKANQAKLSKAETAAKCWPEKEKLAVQLNDLRTQAEENENRKKKAALDEKLAKLSDIQTQLDDANKKLSRFPDISEDAKSLSEAEKDLVSATGKLTSSKLRAELKLENGYTAEITDAEGNTSNVTCSSSVDADGYISIVIPGAAAIRVSPQDMNVEELEAQKNASVSRINEIYKKYSVNSAEGFTALETELKQLRESAETLKRNKQLISGEKTFDELKQEAEQIQLRPDIKVSESIDFDIKKLLSELGARSVDMAIGKIENEIKLYESEYIDPTELEKIIKSIGDEIKHCRERLDCCSGCPDISERDFDLKISQLKAAVENYNDQINELNKKLGELSSTQYPEISELEELAADAKIRLKNEKKKLKQYERIKADFEEIASSQDNGFDGFYNTFNSYLSEITGVGLSFIPDASALDLKNSHSNIDKELYLYLSEGTKKTLLLAFRLSVLDYLYPDGNGFAVLDDELIDMDPDRRKNAASLLKKFAEKNQVIMMTCDPAIAALLSDKPIMMH